METTTAPALQPPRRAGGLPRMQEAGLLIVVLLLGGVLAILGRPIFLRPHIPAPG